ncbi:MAG: trypsin-like peptidase domain-containing protein [Myxococcaceae bacterium]
MKRSFPIAVACGVLATVPSAHAETPKDWFRTQARAHGLQLDRSAQAPVNETQLWRERRGTDPMMEGFVPPTSLAPLVRAVRSGVVNISTGAGKGLARPERAVRRSLGSGFIISPDGHVVTNNHVIAAADTILVQLSTGDEYTARVVGRDASTDVALLRLEASPDDLPYVFLGDSDALEVGDWVVAIGNPFGLDHSVSHGMISAKERVLGLGIFDDFVQTDALINPGNSGGPLFNMQGEVIGVNSAIMSQGQGIGFAVPINMVKELIPNLRENGRLARGWLGVNIVDASNGNGAVVTEVYRGSPAAEAGLTSGDRVLSVNGRAVDSFQQVLRKVSLIAPGAKVKLQVERAGRQRELEVTLAERPAQDTPRALAAAGAASSTSGMFLSDVAPEVAKSLGLEARGALVSLVLPGSAAERAGIRAGDLLTEVNKQAIRRADDARQVLEQPSLKTALIRFQRGDAIRYVAVDLEPIRPGVPR